MVQMQEMVLGKENVFNSYLAFILFIKQNIFKLESIEQLWSRRIWNP